MSAVSSSDKEIISRFGQGFEIGFEELVKNYESKVYSLSLSLMQNENEAENILCEVFCRALDSFPRSSESELSPSLWLFRETVEYAAQRERVKRCGREIKVEDELPLTPGYSEESDEALLKSALKSLDFEYRTVYVLYEALELSLSEIELILDISQLEARAYLHRARLLVCRHIREQRELLQNSARSRTSRAKVSRILA